MVNSSHHTVEDTLKAAHDTGITWPLEDDVTNTELQGILFPWKYVSDTVYVMPDFAYVHRELAKNGVTLTLLWEEYCTKARSNDSVPYSYTQFGEKYRRWARVTKATMRITHKPGDAMQVDWAGDPLYITDSVTGEQWPVYIFVAVLPCSWYTYAEACGDMKQENWLLCHVHAFDYFGGVPRLLIPDNAKTATITNNRYEVVLNRSYQELAEHYGTAIVPARVRRPDDKAAAEGSVKYVSTWITAALRDRKFFTLDEARRAVIEKLEELNRRPFKKRAGCRFSAFEEEEREFMRPLPATAYEPSVWSHPKVSYDYLVSDGRNKYSVPYDLIGQTVDLRLTRNLVEVYFHGARVAVHVRLATAQRDPVVKPEHMPEAHRKYLGYNEHEFTTWAAGVGPKTLDVVRHFLSQGREVEQGYKACASLTKLANRYGAARLENACVRVLDLSSAPTIRNISALCKAATERKPENSDSGERQDNRYGITRAIIEEDVLRSLQMQVKTAPLFQAYAEAYMTRYKLRKIGANTMVGYRSYLTNHLYPNFGDLPIDSITVDRVQDFMLLEADNGSAKASINRIMQLLTQIMDSAVEDELIIKNPCKSKRLYNPSEKQQKVLPYSPGVYKQMERLLPLLPTDTDKLYLGLSMYAGLRLGEIVALRWEDVDFDLGFIRVRRAIQYAAKNVGTIKPPKTDNGVRDIPMMGQLRAILEALRKDEGFIICRQRGADKDLPMTQQMVRNMDIHVNKFFAEHGIKEPFKSHRMRHTVLTLLNNSRLADDKSLQAWAGHRDAAFTRRQYMTPQEEQLQTVGNGFSEYISSLL